MPAWLDLPAYWYWWALGAVLVLLEIFSPGVFFLWMGLAAGLMGLILWFAPGLEWTGQLLGFALFSLISVAAGRWWLGRHPIPSDTPTLNRRAEQYLGRTFTLEEPIVNGFGRIHVDDTLWRVEGEDCPAGTRVRVVEARGVILAVECLKEENQ